MRIGNRELIVIGDRILVAIDDGEECTRGGILVPATAVNQRSVQKGRVVAVGPGIPVPQPTEIADEPWKERAAEGATYVPLQAQVGDTAVFLKNAAIAITVEDRNYFIVPNAAVLVLERALD
ncbi:MAG: co-chaperone GroES [Planctomycetes bacterium]|nr:co-chaperone GroES [Planctomycetota bacterium]